VDRVEVVRKLAHHPAMTPAGNLLTILTM